jgi:hypothetical protein
VATNDEFRKRLFILGLVLMTASNLLASILSERPIPIRVAALVIGGGISFLLYWLSYKGSKPASWLFMFLLVVGLAATFAIPNREPVEHPWLYALSIPTGLIHMYFAVTAILRKGDEATTTPS